MTKLLRRSETPDIIRATAVDLLSNYRNTESDRLCRQAFSDSSPLVRSAAVRSISNVSQDRFVKELVDRLEDPIRIVRSAAARRLVQDATENAKAEYQQTLSAAISEYLTSQEMTLERGGSHINMAALRKALHKYDEAQESLQNAIRLEPYLSGVRGELASIMEQQRGDPEEIRRLREVEVELMERDSRLIPSSPQPHYQRGMLLYLLDRHEEALQALETACELAPNSFDNWMALALLCEKEQRWQKAIQALKNMTRIRPDDPRVGALYQQMRQAASQEDK